MGTAEDVAPYRNGMVEVEPPLLVHDHGQGTLYMDSGSTAALISSLRAFIDDAETRERIGSEGRRLFTSRRMSQMLAQSLA
jgi:hypothetical protein